MNRETVRRIDEREGRPDALEAVDPEDLVPGDRVLVSAGERVGIQGRIVRSHAGEYASQVTDRENTTTSGDDLAELERDGERRPASVGETVGPDDTVHGGHVVVEIDRPGLLPWVPIAAVGALFSGRVGVRITVAVLVLVAVVAGTGLGLHDDVTEYVRTTGDRVTSMVGGGETEGAGSGGNPSAPPVTVTPPDETDTADGTAGEDSGGNPTTTTTEAEGTASEVTTTSDTTTTPTATTTTAAGTTAATATDGSSGLTGGGGLPAVESTLSVHATDPPRVRSSDGSLNVVSGTVTGSLTWTGRADAVVLVVQSRAPDGSWAEVERLTVTDTDSGSISLAAVLGETTYAAGERTAPFANAARGTTRSATGHLSVTAVLFRDGTEVDRTKAADAFEVTVTNTDAPLSLRLGDGEGTTEIFDFGDTGAGSGSGVAVPGTTGSNRVPITNDGATRGVLELADVTYVSYENGLTGPESAVDDTGGDPGAGAGELYEAVEIRAVAEFENGTERYVVGNETAYRSLRSLENESATVGLLDAGESVDFIVSFRVPKSAGNEIQSDTVAVDFSFTLRQSQAVNNTRLNAVTNPPMALNAPEGR